jgi:thioester reductase-like protein
MLNGYARSEVKMMVRGQYAIVGYGFRMPGGIHTGDDFWRLLSERDVVREPVADRYGPGFEPVAGQPGPSRFGSGYEGLMHGKEAFLFDCHLFGVSRREATGMDPQLRQLLTCTWEAFEQAGWDHARLRNSRTGVFIGAQVSASSGWRPMLGPNEYAVTGTSVDMFANRLSYTFNLMGPSATCLTACSSGATALHAAITALAAGDCDQAVIGASTFLGSGQISAGFASLGVISPDGGCRSFDVGANGYMRSEGAFIFLLRPLAAAEADGDRILAVVAGTAVNAAGAGDGATGSAPGRMITAPTKHAQVTLMRAACDSAGISPDQVSYLEAHATGTRVGDRVEGNAIGQVFGGSGRAQPVRLSSVKSNVGHMEAAAFCCALLKVLLMFERRTYAPISRHFAVPSPDIDFTGMHVQTECESFGPDPVTVGINSFGFGGTNGHCLLTEYRPPREATRPEATPGAAYLIPLSARSPEALRTVARELASLVKDPASPEEALDLATLAGNLARRRTHFGTRTAFAADSVGGLARCLTEFADEAPDAAPLATVPDGTAEPRVMLAFAGQGTQWAGCGRELYDTEPVFRASIDEVDAVWREHARFSLRDECFGASQERVDETQIAQPMIFMIEAALTELLRSWGIRPVCVVGHSAGEVGAAYAAGIFSLADATRLIYHRATRQQRTAGSGRMLAVTLDRVGTEEILREIGGLTLEIACENAPASTVVCGSAADITLAAEVLERRDISCRLLRGNVAFHSRAMDPIEDDLRASLAFLDDLPMKASVPFVSSVTGEVTEKLDATYWWANVRQPVLFAAAIETALSEFRPDVVVEVSPHDALVPAVRQCLAGPDTGTGHGEPACVPTLKRDTDSRLSFTQALAALYREGVPLDFAARHPRIRPVSHLLPRHPRNEQPLTDARSDDMFAMKQGDYSAGPLVGRRLPGGQPRFEVRMSAADFPWLAEHRVQDASIVPAAGYVEMVLQAIGGAPANFPEIEFRKPCMLTDTPVRLQTELEPEPGQPGAFSFRIFSQPYPAADGTGDAAPAELHCLGRVRRLTVPPEAPGFDRVGRSRFTGVRFSSRRAFYDRVEAVIGDYFQYGPAFQVIQSGREDASSSEVLLDLRVGNELWQDCQRAGYLFPPALLDGGLQSMIYYMVECADVSCVPLRMEDFTVDRLPASPRLVAHYVPPATTLQPERGQLASLLGEQHSGSVTLYDSETGERVAHLRAYFCSFANPRQDVLGRSRHAMRWQPKFADPARLAMLTGRVPAGPDGGIDLAALIAALRTGQDGMGPRPVLRVAEFAANAAPEETALAGCLTRDGEATEDDLGGAEFWLLGSSPDAAKRLLAAFGQTGGATGANRVAVADLAHPETIDFAEGLLREAACDVVVADARRTPLSPAAWQVIRQLLVPGGLAVIRDADDGPDPAAAGWTRLRAGQPAIGQAALWAAPAELPDERAGAERGCGEHAAAPGDRWLIAGPGTSADWPASDAELIAMDSLEPGWLWSAAVQERLRGLSAIDFCPGTWDSGTGDGAHGTGGDPLGQRLTTRFLELMRALVTARQDAGSDDAPRRCRVTVITERAAMDVAAPRGAVLWGAARSLGHELDTLIDLRLIDISGLENPRDLAALGWLARHDVRERELAIRDGMLYAPRLVSLPGQGEASVPAAEAGRYRLELTAPGQIAGLTVRTVPAEPPGPGEVEVAVAATALNFRDVMVALGMLPLSSYERSALGRRIGFEGAGTVTQTGAGVTSVTPGEEVLFMSGGCAASSVTVPERAVIARPRALSVEQGAAALSVYVTAYYALAEIARLRAGQRVLIHSAMGGVGQAAIALARRAGAVIYATAGTPEKRARLRELGAVATFDSHSFDWYGELMDATGGEGVDVVLNSLAGHHLELCLQALRPGGWHCEIGKVDIYANSTLGLSVFRKNLHFAAIDIDRLTYDDPDRARELIRECVRLLDRGEIPPLPVTAYGFERYAESLRFMASGQHEGKIVLTAPDDAAGRSLRVADQRPFLDSQATYLVTGGLGGLGRRLVSYLVYAGARHLTLLDRDPGQGRDAAWLRSASGIARYFPGTEVELDIVPADAASRADVDRVIRGLARPLKGVFHLAGVLDDRQLGDITPTSVAAVFGPKAGGAWNLHQATLDAPLDHFVLFSSIAAVMGNTGQAVYAGANAFLDALAAHRRGNGLPGLAFNLAALAETGMALRGQHVLRLARSSGLPPVSAAVAIANLDAALRGAHPDADHVICADIGRLPGDADHLDFMRAGRWMSDAGALGGEADGLTADAIAADLCRQISRMSGHEEVGATETIASFGVNSVSIAELSAFIRSRFGHQVGILDLMTTATPRSVAEAILSGKAGQQAGAAGPRAATAFTGTALRSGQAHAVAGSDASLPDQCQEDLEQLRRTIRDLMAAEPSPAVPAGKFRAVLLTGAVGFVGRFVLAELLRQADGLTVHCLVRADNPEHGLERIRRAMRDAEIWDEEFTGRIRVWPGDITEPSLGLDPDDFAWLAGETDAVYHLAAELNLVSSYAAVRDVNTRSLGDILKLAFTGRVKHLVYSSTMGVFPQYFAGFAGDFADLPVEDEARPDIALMRSVLPPGFTGYPWSKLTVEESLRFARSHGMPVTIMRLPEMGSAAATGYTQNADIAVRIAMAIYDTGLVPAGFRLRWTEPVDTVAETLVRLSLSPRREHAIYHLVNPEPATHGLSPLDFGLDLREVSYPEFKLACQARGAQGPLHGYWALVDYFADLWFPADGDSGRRSWQGRQPIATGAVSSRLGTNRPAWAGIFTTTERSLSWIGRHAAQWPYNRPSVMLDADGLRQQAVAFADRAGVRFEDAYPAEVFDGLGQLVAALRAPAARIREDRRSAVSLQLSRRLWDRATLAGELARHPEIAAEPVERPVFILGTDRTGTTLLHRMLARGDRLWAPTPPEIVCPALPPGESPSQAALVRRRYADDLLTASGITEALHGIHQVDMAEPDEEHSFLEDSFAAWTFSMQFEIPDYTRWLAGHDASFAYAGHLQAMRHLGWQRRTGRSTGEEQAPRRWLLKMPFHLAELPTLAATYPDAIFVQTHRTPLEFLAPWNGLVRSIRELWSDTGGQADLAALGAGQLDLMSRMLEGVARLRQADPELNRRFIDVSYLDLIESPLRVVDKIYQQLGWPVEKRERARMKHWLTEDAVRWQAEPRHQYSLAEYGLSTGQVETAFSGYAEFTRMNKIRMA